jgi:osmotically inducible protein OsmC
MKSTASATWKGTGKEGSGTLNSKSGVLNNANYTYKTRFEGAPGTNPEELIAAAHAGCFAMKLSFVLVAAGFTADQLDVSCDVTLESGKVTESSLTLKAKVPNIDKAKFDECVNDAVKNCPISKLLNTEIKIQSQLA